MRSVAHRRLLSLLAGSIVVAAASGGCAAPASGVDDGDVDPDAGAPSADAGADAGNPASTDPCPGALAERNGLTAADLERLGFAGTTDIRVRFCNPLLPVPPPGLLFFVWLDDHTGVPPSDLTRGSSIVTSDGRQVASGFAWEGSDLSAGDHHAEGRLSAPKTAADGSALIQAGTTWFELQVNGIGDGQYPQVFRWADKEIR